MSALDAAIVKRHEGDPYYTEIVQNVLDESIHEYIDDVAKVEDYDWAALSFTWLLVLILFS